MKIILTVSFFVYLVTVTVNLQKEFNKSLSDRFISTFTDFNDSESTFLKYLEEYTSEEEDILPDGE